MRVGNKKNSYLNFIYAKHGRKDGKKLAARRRRAEDKEVVRNAWVAHVGRATVSKTEGRWFDSISMCAPRSLSIAGDAAVL